MSLDRNILKKFRNKQWYHQGFDGAPLYIGFIAEAEVTKESRKPAGAEADVRVCFFKDGKGDWYLDMADIERGAKVITDLARRDPNISTKLLAKWRRDEIRFQNFFNRFGAIHLSQLTDSALLQLYKTLYRLALRRFTSSAIIDHFALGTDQIIATMLRKEIGTIKNESQFTEIFSIATAPVHQSFINEAEMQLLKIALRTPDSIKNIQHYQQKYFWLKNNYYSAHILSVEHFRKEIALWKKSGGSLKAKYKQLKETPRQNAKNKVALFKKYQFSPLLRTLFKISEDFTWWQDERKKATFLNIHMGIQIMNEMARRRNINQELTKFLVAPEVEQWFTNLMPAVRELEKRATYCSLVLTREGYDIVTGKRVDELRGILFPKKNQDHLADFRGLSASVGRVTGPVKVVRSATEVGKVQPGDILVASMTRPDYIMGIKRAAAIVTNEGGVTCHAAIVSRELGIPCIIGTKIATEVLHDGDMVDVNANHGVVTILHR